MQLQFELTQDVVVGSNPVVIHDIDNTVMIVYKAADGTMQGTQTTTPLGDWSSRVFTPIGRISGEIAVQYMHSKTITGFISAFVWYADGLHRIAVVPDNSPMYEDTDFARLYYGIDTEKLYMNIAQEWEFIATLHHGLLKDLNADNHPQYLNNARLATNATMVQVLADIQAIKTRLGM